MMAEILPWAAVSWSSRIVYCLHDCTSWSNLGKNATLASRRGIRMQCGCICQPNTKRRLCTFLGNGIRLSWWQALDGSPWRLSVQHLQSVSFARNILTYLISFRLKFQLTLAFCFLHDPSTVALVQGTPSTSNKLNIIKNGALLLRKICANNRNSNTSLNCDNIQNIISHLRRTNREMMI